MELHAQYLSPGAGRSGSLDRARRGDDHDLLIPLATIEITFREAISVGVGPAGDRLVGELATFEMRGELLSIHLRGVAAADWAIVSPNAVLSPDVRRCPVSPAGSKPLTPEGGLDPSHWMRPAERAAWSGAQAQPELPAHRQCFTDVFAHVERQEHDEPRDRLAGEKPVKPRRRARVAVGTVGR